MKKILMYWLCFFLLNSALITIAAPECIDRSWHLERSGDTKAYHAISCNCPCGSYSSNDRYKIIADRGRCVECRHFRVFRPSLAAAIKVLRIELYDNAIHPQGAALRNLFRSLYQN